MNFGSIVVNWLRDCSSCIFFRIDDLRDLNDQESSTTDCNIALICHVVEKEPRRLPGTMTRTAATRLVPADSSDADGWKV